MLVSEHKLGLFSFNYDVSLFTFLARCVQCKSDNGRRRGMAIRSLTIFTRHEYFTLKFALLMPALPDIGSDYFFNLNYCTVIIVETEL